MVKFRHKAFAALLAAAAGALGANRLYLGQRGWWLPLSVTALALPLLAGVKNWYQTPAFFILMIPVTAGFIQALVIDTGVPFDDSKFKPGDEVASHQSHPLAGDRADIKVAMTWNNGVQTSVMSRKLVTGSKYDVQFDKLDARYAFGFAAFDNAQVRHAVHFDPLYLRFAK